MFDAKARIYDPLVPRFWSVDPLAEISRRFSPYIYGNSNPMLFIDPDGMSAQDVEQYTTNDGTTVSYDVNTQKTLGYDTSTQEGEGDEKEKQGYYPSGVMRPASQQNAVMKPTEPKKFGSNFTPEEKAGHEGVYTGAEIITGETVLGFLKIGQWLKSLFNLSDDVAITTASKVLNPKDIHFMQSSIKNATGDFTVLGNAEALRAGVLNPEVLRINVWKDASGKIWTLDHRRLAAFRLSGLNEVPINWVSPSQAQSQMWKMTTTNGGSAIRLKLGNGQSINVK